MTLGHDDHHYHHERSIGLNSHVTTYEPLQPHQPAHCCYCCYRKGPGGEPTWLFACTPCRCCFCSLCGLLLIVLGAEFTVGYFVSKAFVQRHYAVEENVTSCTLKPEDLKAGNTFCGYEHGNLLTPKNMTHSLWFPACTNTYLIDEMAEFNKRHDYKEVRFFSRAVDGGPPKVMLTGWWLPATQPQAPVIIVVHGENENYNDWSVQLPAYFLRSMGFSVLIPNLRDHGSSGRSTGRGGAVDESKNFDCAAGYSNWRKGWSDKKKQWCCKTCGFACPDGDSRADAMITWGYAYHLDVLGAWDYLLQDTNGVFGGPVPANKIGLMGHGMGGFVAAIATGVEPTVRGAWLDTPVYSPRNMMKFDLEELMGLVSTAFIHVSWFLATKFAGADLEAETPKNAVAARAAALCKVALVANTQDSFVPFSETELLRTDLLANSAYKVEEYFAEPARCGIKDRLTLAAWKPDTYRQKLCDFWTNAFGISLDACGISELPHFATDVGSSDSWAPRPVNIFVA